MRKKIELVKSASNFTFEEGYKEFIRVRRILQVSPATIKHYNGTYTRFTSYFDSKQLCSEITINVVYGFIEFLKEKNSKIQVKTINTYLIDLRAIFNFLAEQKRMAQFKLSLLKDEVKIKETYSDEELEKLLKKPDINRFSQYRNWVLVCYFMATGNRASTVCSLKVKDFDFNNHEITLKKLKSKRQYIIPMSEALEKIILEYMQYRDIADDDYMFCNQFGEPLVYDALSSAIKRYNHSRGVSKTSIHLFRHTFAKKWILNGGDIFRLQKILGHKNLEMVKQYVEMFGGDLKNNFEKFNPLDNMNDVIKDRTYITMNKKRMA